MKFIINTFDNALIYKVAFKLRGEIVSDNENLVLVEYSDEYKLANRIKELFGMDFRITPFDGGEINFNKNTKEIIEFAIKKQFLTKENFCKKNNYKYKNFASKLRSVESKIIWLNNFLKPLNLKVEITEIESKD